MRSANSRVRCETVYDITPYSPMAASSNASPAKYAQHRPRDALYRSRPVHLLLHRDHFAGRKIRVQRMDLADQSLGHSVRLRATFGFPDSGH